MTLRHWISPTDATWNNTANWSLTSGGSGGASVPPADSTVFFDMTSSGNCIIDTAAIISSLFIRTLIKVDGSCSTTDLHLESGAMSKVSDSTIHVTGNLYDGSNYNLFASQNDFTIVLEGSNVQNIYNQSGGVIPSLIIDKTSSAHVFCQGDSPVRIKDQFLIQDGTFNMNGLDVQVGI